jgi:SAM-dependent methyltransferase
MSWKSKLRRWTPPVIADGFDRRRADPEDRAVARYLAAGRVPFSEGYGEFRNRTITATLDDPDLMDRFATGKSLPTDFAHGLDERCVEYPWALGQLGKIEGLVLDAGSALNHAFLLKRPELHALRLHIVTLAPEAHAFWQLGHGYLYEDLRRLPMDDAVYDAVASISTLEHVGCDNRAYTGNKTTAGSKPDDLDVMVELRRVLKPGGVLLFTVPFGRPDDLGSFRQFDSDRLESAIAAFGPTAEDDRRFYRYGGCGWEISDADSCIDSEYVDWICQHPDERDPDFPVQADHAAAARAVALVRLVLP